MEGCDNLSSQSHNNNICHDDKNQIHHYLDEYAMWRLHLGMDNEDSKTSISKCNTYLVWLGGGINITTWSLKR